MPCCLVALLLLFGPRILLGYIYLTSNIFPRVFDTWVWPTLGFIFMPWTTLAFIYDTLNYGGVNGTMAVVLLVIGILFDLGSNGGSSKVSVSK